MRLLNNIVPARQHTRDAIVSIKLLFISIMLCYILSTLAITFSNFYYEKKTKQTLIKPDFNYI